MLIDENQFDCEQEKKMERSSDHCERELRAILFYDLSKILWAGESEASELNEVSFNSRHL